MSAAKTFTIYCHQNYNFLQLLIQVQLLLNVLEKLQNGGAVLQLLLEEWAKRWAMIAFAVVGSKTILVCLADSLAARSNLNLARSASKTSIHNRLQRCMYVCMHACVLCMDKCEYNRRNKNLPTRKFKKKFSIVQAAKTPKIRPTPASDMWQGMIATS